MTKRFSLIFTLVLLSLQGCGYVPYRIDVDQGNIVSEKSITQLKTGMTKQQVIGLLGKPLLNDPFHANRWDYIRHFTDGQTQKITKSTLTLTFVDNRLANIETSVKDTSLPE